jgi:hypothetical protein
MDSSLALLADCGIPLLVRKRLLSRSLYSSRIMLLQLLYSSFFVDFMLLYSFPVKY